MGDALSFVEFLFELGASELLVSRSDSATLAAIVVVLHDGRRLLAVERTYRDGICILFDPTEEEIETARSGDLWQLWNSDRMKFLDSVS